jgi:S-formylglutathione hydrolase FrmB
MRDSGHRALVLICATSVLSVTLAAVAGHARRAACPENDGVSGTAQPPTRDQGPRTKDQPAAQPPTKDQGPRTKDDLAFTVTFAASLRREPVTGRIYVLLAPSDSNEEPRLGPDWFSPQPFFARNVENWRPGESLRIDSHADGFPTGLDELKPGRYKIQAVARLNPDTHRIGNGEGNLYGPVVAAQLDPGKPALVALELDRALPPRVFRATNRIKLAELPSPMLSSFSHRPIKHRAAVILPEGLRAGENGRKLPALYIIPGFGGDHFLAPRIAYDERTAFGKDLIRVVLDPDCGTGHHVFANSATNGPRGTALVDEFIPYLEREFPIIAEPRARFLTGHSSGGWSSLWLQVSFPDRFGGTWSTSPDPVDFRDFQRINIYAPGENMFRDRAGKRRPIARMGTIPVLYFDSFSRMDDVIGWGCQLGSFEAVFSPLDREGRPRRLWDRTTGAIDAEVARAWELYDIRLVLERNWARLGPQLEGKLHVIVGGLDTFYLEGAVKLLKESLARLGSDATVEIIPQRDHSNVFSPELARRLDREIRAACRGLRPAGAAGGD